MDQLKQMASQIDAYNKTTMVQMRVTKVKDKTPNPIQITAEQIIADPEIHQLNSIIMPLQHLIGQDEVAGYKEKKRKEFEEQIRRQRFHIGLWIRYAEWEAMLQEFRRARSVYERALDVSPYAPSLWMRYVEFEMKNKFVNHARNLFERATTVMPRVDQFWYKYIYMEEILGNYAKAREVLGKWVDWNPIAEAWISYASFETRLGENEKARMVMFNFLDKNPKVENYMRVAKFEEKGNRLGSARQVCERAFKEIGEEALNEDFLIYWAKLEEKLKEIDRVGQIYEMGIARLKDAQMMKLKVEYMKFQAKHGKEKDTHKIILDDRKSEYVEELKKQPMAYDSWLNLVLLEQEAGDFAVARQVFLDAEVNVPKSSEKSDWKRFVFIFLAHAIFEETKMSDSGKAVETLEQCLKLIPHKQFSFSKIWVHLAKLHIRNQDVQSARLVLGKGIGQYGSKSIFTLYLDMESKLGNFERCRKIHERWIEINPHEADNWIAYFKMENDIGEIERARMVIRKSLEMPFIAQPELLWKTAIDFEISQNKVDQVVSLYTLLLERTKHVKVFISLALFYLSHGMVVQMRNTFEEAEKMFKVEKMNEERAMVLNNWFECELQVNDRDQIEKIQGKLPTRIKKQRVVENGEEGEAQYEEYVEYVFNDEMSGKEMSNLQKRAMRWKEKDVEVRKGD